MSIQMQKLYSHKLLWLVFWRFLFHLWIKSRYFPRTCCWTEEGRQQQMGRTGITKEGLQRSQTGCLRGAPHCSKDITYLGSVENHICSWRETIFKKHLPKVIYKKGRGGPKSLETCIGVLQGTGHVPFTWRARGAPVDRKKKSVFLAQNLRGCSVNGIFRSHCAHSSQWVTHKMKVQRRNFSSLPKFSIRPWKYREGSQAPSVAREFRQGR